MRSKIDIWNSALLKIGAKPLASPDEKSVAKTVCEQFYTESVEEILNLHHWNCAIVRTEIAANSTGPAFGWTYSYNLPLDCLNVVKMANDAKFVIEGRQLLTDSDTCQMKYIKKINDPNLFSPGVVKCIILQLAANIAPTLKSDNKNFAESMLNQLYQIAIPEARMIDAHENNAAPEPNGWLNYDTPPVLGNEGVNVYNK